MDQDPPLEELPKYCEAALPVPLDKTFTYAVPPGLREGICTGSRVVVPFANRSLTGIVLATQTKEPQIAVRAVSKLLDEVPALTAELMTLGRWVARYYCAPIGEVLKAMLPLRGHTRYKQVISLTPEGRRLIKEMVVPTGIGAEVLSSLRKRPLTLPYLLQKHKGAGESIRWLRKRGLVAVERVTQTRDPTLARGAVLRVRGLDPGAVQGKLTAGERWLLDYLSRNPGFHDLRALSVERKDAVPTARRLAKSGAVHLEARQPKVQRGTPSSRFELNESQQAALDAIRTAIRQSRFQTFLLHGVTGSGKTEVYLRAIEAALALGRSSLLMVPEIALTPALASQFFDRFGDRTAVLHSGLTPVQRSDQWQRIRSGHARVVLGTRSAVFAPLMDLGLAIVDEEHDSSYKQGVSPRYNGRDVAVVRARAAAAVVVLGSATPGLETRRNAETGKFSLLTMPQRIFERPLPSVRRVDMRLEFAETGRALLFSRDLVKSVSECLGKGEQAMILLNRRGYSTYVLCRSCGERMECPNCSVTLTYHRRAKQLLCHYCDHSEPVPTLCRACGRKYLYFYGSGSEKVEDELRKNFPDARIARLDRDTVRGRGYYETILGAFRKGDCNLLVGTQMIAKGHDIPNVTLVCVVDADVGLGRPDFRAAERTFQLLTQVAGRAGRGEKPGHVLIQTMNPDHYAIDLSAEQDYDAFYRRETRFRKALWYPPFTSMATIVVRSGALADALEMSRDLGSHLQTLPAGLRLIGPASAPMVRLRSEYRFQFLIKSLSRKGVADVLGRARGFAHEKGWPPTALVVDVDPLDFN